MSLLRTESIPRRGRPRAAGKKKAEKPAEEHKPPPIDFLGNERAMDDRVEQAKRRREAEELAGADVSGFDMSDVTRYLTDENLLKPSDIIGIRTAKELQHFREMFGKSKQAADQADAEAERADNIFDTRREAHRRRQFHDVRNDIEDAVDESLLQENDPSLVPDGNVSFTGLDVYGRQRPTSANRTAPEADTSQFVTPGGQSIFGDADEQEAADRILDQTASFVSADARKDNLLPLGPAAAELHQDTHENNSEIHQKHKDASDIIDQSIKEAAKPGYFDKAKEYIPGWIGKWQKGKQSADLGMEIVPPHVDVPDVRDKNIIAHHTTVQYTIKRDGITVTKKIIRSDP